MNCQLVCNVIATTVDVVVEKSLVLTHMTQWPTLLKLDQWPGRWPKYTPNSLLTPTTNNKVSLKLIIKF